MYKLRCTACNWTGEASTEDEAENRAYRHESDHHKSAVRVVITGGEGGSDKPATTGAKQ